MRSNLTRSLKTPVDGKKESKVTLYARELHTRLRNTEELLNDQYSLFHNLYSRENQWYNVLSVLIIFCSSLMTFLGALDFLMPEAMRASGYDRIPSLVLSFLTTLICSIMKFWDFQSRLSNTQEGAERTQSQVKKLEVVRERLESWINGDVTISQEVLDKFEIVLSGVTKSYHDIRKLLLKLPPDLILSFEKAHQMRALRRQKRQISRDMSRLFQKAIEKRKRDVNDAIRLNNQLPDAAPLQDLLLTHKELLRQHTIIMDYTNNFEDTMETEYVSSLTFFQRLRWLCWLVWFRAKCCKPKTVKDEEQGIGD